MRVGSTSGFLLGALLLTVDASSPQALDDESPWLFRTSDRCMACHNGLVTPSGEDVSIGTSWRSSMMANSSRDPYWQAGVRREVLDHPETKEAIEDECSKCHMPMMRFVANRRGAEGEVFAHAPGGQASTRASQLAADGVSCAVCHQIQAEGLGSEESFTGGFEVDTTHPWGERSIFGPYDVDAGRTTIMRSATDFRPTNSTHIRSSELCATCHTLITHSLGPNGEVIGELPEQVPYLEWRHSEYRDQQSCQDCHMPAVEVAMPITSVLGEPRQVLARHAFRGGNFFMLRMLNRYRQELGVEALPQELATAARETVEHLQTQAAVISVERTDASDGSLEVDVSIRNLAGHKLPTAYPSRRVWVHFMVRDRQGEILFESGALSASGSVEGNDNDADPTRYEPHHALIDREDQVQIYESIMVGPDDGVTTGLLTATRFIKDNRLLPRGFDKTTAEDDIATRGGAREDPDFTGGGDRLRYRVNVSHAEGPYRIAAELWYQPIGYRWAQNLAPYAAAETERFVRYYDSMSSGSAVMLTRATAE